MKQRHRRPFRIQTVLAALLLALPVGLSACAPANLSEQGSADASDWWTEMVVPPLSESDAQQLATSGELAKAETLLPKERSTTLEYLTTVKVGQGELFAYNYNIREADPEHCTLSADCNMFADENGKVYLQMVNRLVCLTDGTAVTIPEQYETYKIVDMVVSDGTAYLLYGDEKVEAYSMKEGLQASYALPEPKGTGAYVTRLGLDANRQPLVIQNGKQFFTVEGTSVESTRYPTAIQAKDGTTIYAQKASLALEEGSTLLGSYDSNVYTMSIQLNWGNPNRLTEELYRGFDANGNVTAQFRVADLYVFGEYKSCYVEFDVCTAVKYAASTVTIGDQVFQDTLADKVIAGADGNFYLAIFYPEYMKLYRVNAGYEPKGFSDEVLGLVEMPKQAESASSLQPTSVSPQATNEAAHVTIKRNDAFSRAEAMISLTWTLESGHKVRRPSTTLPHPVSSASVGATMTGIPYCWGGFNGYEDEGTSYRNKAFSNVVGQSISSSYANRYMAGNINCTGLFKGETIGVDCSGFLSSAYDFSSKLGTYGLYEYGHEVSLSQMLAGDMFVEPGNHCMMFYSASGSQVVVYEATLSGNFDRAVRNTRSLEYLESYAFLSPFYDWKTTSTQHWRACRICGEELSGTRGNHVVKSPSVYCLACGVIPSLQKAVAFGEAVTL